MDKLFESTWGLGRHTLWNEFLRLRNIVTWWSHLYILLHKWVLMILEFILHSLGAASILRSVIASYLLWSNYCLYAAFCDSGGGPLIINSCHVLVGWAICSRYLLILYHLMLLPLSLFPFETALLLDVHLHRGIVVGVVRIEVYKPVSGRNISSRVASTWKNCSVAWRCAIAIAVSRSANAEVRIFNINSLESCIFILLLLISTIIIHILYLRRFLFVWIHFIVEL